MTKWFSRQLTRAARALSPRPDQSTQLAEAASRERFLTQKLAEIAEREEMREAARAFDSMAGDLIEARAMAGAGPWKVGSAALEQTDKLTKSLKESFEGKVALREDFTNAAGAYGDIELALSTWDWRREINFSVLQFSRWGIQQIILISRLYYIKNPIVRRLVDVCAAYVFARGVEVTTGDDAANETLKEFFEDNRNVFGQVALVQSERMKDTDGNLFWVLFADKTDSGKCKARIIDATEINEIVANPEDSDEEWLFLRIWVQQNYNEKTGIVSNKTEHAWYPAMGYSPADKPDTIRNWPVMWDCVVHHRKCGFVGKWTFGCPRVYPMLDWAKEARHFLEACAGVQQALLQVALKFTSKGGQQALVGFKQQMGTTVGPSTQVWDTNPPAVSGATVGMGPGSSLEAFKTQGAGGDPEGVRQYKLMCAMVAGVPETFLADVSTGNLATATSLDRPTETIFLEKQESWREDLTVIAKYVLEISAGATGGKLSEARRFKPVQILECRKHRSARGAVVYEAFDTEADDKIEIQVNFPDIREGDMPAKVGAIVKAITLDNKSGQAIGIDLKTAVIALYNELGIEGGEAKAEEQFPEGEYEIDRTKQIVSAPLQKPQALPGGQPQINDKGEPSQQVVPQAPPIQDEKVKEALAGVGAAIGALKLNGRN